MNIKYIEGDEYLPSGYYCKVGNVFYLIEDLINNKDKEIERLNNIINELERELDRGYLGLFEHELVLGRKLITNIKNYLQELKDSDK